MYAQFDSFQKASKDGLDTAVKSYGAYSKGAQAIAVEFADYAKKSFEAATGAAEKLFAVKSLDKAFEVQADYMKSSYEGFVSYATKVGELYQGLAKEAFKPFESVAAPVAPSKGR